mmetsp:Transcript_8348/g.22232  ORF Transcript_8348/g.22232 Transcript_8348/m.22232 type:complete len:222 (-) Transcript_8348:989-1654(-)
MNGTLYLILTCPFLCLPFLSRSLPPTYHAHTRTHHTFTHITTTTTTITCFSTFTHTHMHIYTHALPTSLLPSSLCANMGTDAHFAFISSGMTTLFSSYPTVRILEHLSLSAKTATIFLKATFEHLSRLFARMLTVSAPSMVSIHDRNSSFVSSFSGCSSSSSSSPSPPPPPSSLSLSSLFTLSRRLEVDSATDVACLFKNPLASSSKISSHTSCAPSTSNV